MPVWQVNIQKAVGGVFWTNRYFVEAPAIEDGIPIMQQLVTVERNVHLAYVDFISCRISKPGKEKPTEYITIALSGEGNRPAPAVVPLTLTVRVEFYKGPHRPDLKYLRGVCEPTDWANARNYTATFVSFMVTNYTLPMADIEGLVSIDAQTYKTIQCSPKISQHQLSRGTRKKTTPKIPVS